MQHMQAEPLQNRENESLNFPAEIAVTSRKPGLSSLVNNATGIARLGFEWCCPAIWRFTVLAG